MTAQQQKAINSVLRIWVAAVVGASCVLYYFASVPVIPLLVGACTVLAVALLRAWRTPAQR